MTSAIKASAPEVETKTAKGERGEKRTEGKRFAYVTLLLGKSDWWKGVVGLAKSLMLVGSQYPLLVAAGEEVPEEHREAITSHGCRVVIVEIRPILPPSRGSNEESFSVAYYKLLYTKLRIWEMDGYDRLVYLDADTLVLQNLDHLFFSVPDGALGASLDCFCEGNGRKNGYCQVDESKSPWEGPEPKPLPYFNAGVLVMTPSRKAFGRIMDVLAAQPPAPLAEQDLLNDIYGGGFFKLPYEYNMLIPLLWHHPAKVNLGAVKVVHFSVVGSKPWKYDATKEHLSLPMVKWFIALWEKVFNANLN